MPEGFSAQGTLLASSPDPNWPPTAPQGGSVTFTNIAELRALTPPNLSRNELETTTHNEADDAYLVGIRRKGTLTASLNFVPSGSTHNSSSGIVRWMDTGERRIWRIRFPDGTAWIFSGFVTNVGPQADVDSILTADISVRPTGATQYTTV